MKSEAEIVNGGSPPATKGEGKYLTFSLDGEEYGIFILKIREIIGMMPITSVPETPHYVKGVINLRGKVIPVIDLRLRFGMKEIEFSERTCIIVVEIVALDGLVAMGIVVDGVSEVVNVKSEDIEPVPTLGGNHNADYILGVAKIAKSVKLLLDIDRLIEGDRCEAIPEAA